MANSDLKTFVLRNLRSVTQSRNGKVPLKCQESNHRDLLGTPIPLKGLGYSLIQAFLTNIPDVISLKQKEGQLIAEGVADSKTAHIVSSLNRQETAKDALNSKPQYQDGDIIRPVTPDSLRNYVSEPVSNNYIRSPRPLQTTRNNIDITESISKRLESAGTAPFSAMSKLEKKLEESLREIKDKNDIVCLIKLLTHIKELLSQNADPSYKTFKELLDELKSLFDPCEYLCQDEEKNKLKCLSFSTDNDIWGKDLTDLKRQFSVTVQRLAKCFLKTLGISEENSQILIETFFNLLYHLHQDKFCVSKESLNKIVKEIENIATKSPIYNKYDSKPQFNVNKKMSKIFRICFFLAYNSCDAEANEILEIILEINSSSDSDFPEGAKTVLDNLMINAIEPITTYIAAVSRTLDCRSYDSIIRKRSALQIILNNSATYISKSDNRKILEYQKIKESIELLDEINKDSCFDSENEF